MLCNICILFILFNKIEIIIIIYFYRKLLSYNKKLAKIKNEIDKYVEEDKAIRENSLNYISIGREILEEIEKKR